eukprot:scaffold51724_cov58-Phaeocystis_antarctica.AAC.1
MHTHGYLLPCHLGMVYLILTMDTALLCNRKQHLLLINLRRLHRPQCHSLAMVCNLLACDMIARCAEVFAVGLRPARPSPAVFPAVGSLGVVAFERF